MCILTTVRNNLNRLKEERKLSQMALAEKLDMSTNNIGHILRGDHAPTIITLDKIAKAFNVQISTLFDEQGEPHEKTTENIHS